MVGLESYNEETVYSKPLPYRIVQVVTKPYSRQSKWKKKDYEANVKKDYEATVARFLHDLNCEIHDRVEMHHYVEIKEMVCMAIKVKQQIKRRSGTCVVYGPSSSPSKPNYRKKN